MAAQVGFEPTGVVSSQMLSGQRAYDLLRTVPHRNIIKMVLCCAFPFEQPLRLMQWLSQREEGARLKKKLHDILNWITNHKDQINLAVNAAR